MADRYRPAGLPAYRNFEDFGSVVLAANSVVFPYPYRCPGFAGYSDPVAFVVVDYSDSAVDCLDFAAVVAVAAISVVHT